MQRLSCISYKGQQKSDCILTNQDEEEDEDKSKQEKKLLTKKLLSFKGYVSETLNDGVSNWCCGCFFIDRFIVRSFARPLACILACMYVNICHKFGARAHIRWQRNEYVDAYVPKVLNYKKHFLFVCVCKGMWLP